MAIKFIAFSPGEGYFKDIFPLNSAEIVTKKEAQPANGKRRCPSWNDIKKRACRLQDKTFQI